MPTKLSDTDITPTLVQERLVAWGRFIRAARLQKRITVAGLCERLGISEATLRRLERGDPGAAAGTYLRALQTLGLIDRAVPLLPASLGAAAGQRVRRTKQQQDDDDGKHF
jgi:transcriptional regulator with XRE-family HTH domain